MNKMLESLQEMIRKMTAVSEHVSGQSEELTKTSSEVGEGSRQAAAAMQQISHGAGVQADETNELSTSMVSYAEKIREANSNGKCIEDASKAVLQLTSEGSCLMTASVSQMNKIDVIMQNAVRKVKGLDGQTKEISVLVAVIQGIAEQTNLLALNAAIEAARAGEQGKGFAVVADEVRKLAVQAAVSVGDITDIVTSIQEESAEVAASLETGYTEVGNGIEKIQDTGETFAKIEASVSDMAIRIQTVSESLGDIAADSEQMNGVIESIASIAEESAAGIEQASASILQTGSSMEGVAGKARELSVLAEDLNSLIRKFVV
ncbi:methyl-accepting chemotaxis protein [Pseudobacillus badius]